MDDAFVKQRPGAPRGFFAAEAAGLAWLGAATADGGAAVVGVRAVDEHSITLDRLAPARPTPADAEAFGRALAVTHAAGAQTFGALPPGGPGRGWIGPLDLAPGTAGTWGAFFAAHRIAPYLRTARDTGAVDAAGARVVDAVAARLAAGDGDLTGPPEPPARLHGDLWSGNVLWTPRGAVLVDASAHGGHRESDLAMLALFGLPHLDRVLAAYDEAAPLAPGRQRRVGLHQLFPLLVHAVLFGAGYGAQAVSVARTYA